MNHIGLFEGIGGFSLAARWMNWNTIAYCEINPFCQKVLKYHFPNTNPHEDIKTTDFTIYRGLCDIVTGGFPCQPYSVAGKRKGTEDDRHLWPEMLRAVREIQPSWVVGENVSGLTTWNEGMVFNQVQVDLEAEGYEVLPFLLPACAVNAPHRRDRIWFIAYSNCRRGTRLQHQLGELEKVRQGRENNETDCNSNATYSLRGRQQRSGWPKRQIHTAKGANRQKHRAFDDGGWPTEPAVCRGNDGISERLDGIAFPNWSKESIKAYGNAIVPQVAFEIYKAIQSFENLNTN